MRITVIGAGAWGSALAVSFAGRHQVSLWARHAADRAGLRERRESRYLTGVRLPDAIAIPESLDESLAASDLALVVTPTAGLEQAVSAVRAAHADLPIAWACKGLEAGTARLPHRIVGEAIAAGVASAALSGPSFALEVARGQPTALTLASTDEGFARELARELHHPRLRVYFTTDVVGVELGGAVKNVMAIATGIADGLALGFNARAALVTRGLAEMTRLGVAAGGRIETFMGLTGLGDLVLTCTGDLSRNRQVGLALAQGRALDEVLGSLGHVAEGVPAARAVRSLAERHGVDMPITAAVCAVLFEGLAPRAAVEALLARDPKSEA